MKLVYLINQELNGNEFIFTSTEEKEEANEIAKYLNERPEKTDCSFYSVKTVTVNTLAEIQKRYEKPTE